MTQFPLVDPIPLPAPIWLFKILHNLTFALHLTSVDLLLGGLTLALLFALMGRAQPAGMIMHRLPTLMAFVINLGVPPLLFAQVLYGRALYTSSVLIGAWWISVIFLLVASYYHLYIIARRAEARQSWTAAGFAALLLVVAIAFIYSNNMTLMLRPQAWASMYHASPSGVQYNSGDPTLFPRWFFFLSGAFPVAGAGLGLLALRAQDDDSKRLLTRWGGIALALGVAVQGVFAWLTLGAQPGGIVAKVMADPLYGIFGYVWGATAVLLFLLGVIAILRANVIVAIVAAVVAFLNVASTVMVRDGIRDFTLRAAGYEVWNRQVVTNWSVVGIFLVLFVAALGIIAYLGTVLAKARRLEEKYA